MAPDARPSACGKSKRERERERAEHKKTSVPQSSTNGVVRQSTVRLTHQLTIVLILLKRREKERVRSSSSVLHQLLP
jgi:hypothetical protein